MGTNPMVIGLRDESSHVYAAPCYAHPQLSFNDHPHYPKEDLVVTHYLVSPRNTRIESEDRVLG